MTLDKRIAEALKRLQDEGYILLEPINYRCPWPGSPTLCAVVESPKRREEVVTFSTLENSNPILGIYPRSLTNI